MSIKQISKVFDDTSLKGNEKLLMLALADNCNDHGVCFPSWNSLMTKTSMSKGSVSKWLKTLEDKELIFRVSRNRKNGSNTSNKYLIYPSYNKEKLDEEDYLIFENSYNKLDDDLVQKLNHPSSEVELPLVQKLNHPSSEVEPLYEPSHNRKFKPSPKKINKKEIITTHLNSTGNSCLNKSALFEWLEFKKYNYEIVGLNKLIKMLSEFSFDIQHKMIDNSIMNNYKGIFEIKQNNNQFNKKTQTEIAIEKAIERRYGKDEIILEANDELF